MTKRLEAVLERIRALPDDEQDEIADELAARLGGDGEVPAWHRQLIAERDAASAGRREAGVPLEDALRRVFPGVRS